MQLSSTCAHCTHSMGGDLIRGDEGGDRRRGEEWGEGR